MPIHAPGKRDHRGKKAGRRRKIVATLTLTAMVDMFSVLTIFLLNYSGNANLIETPEGVILPEAQATKELKPSHVVTITQKDVRVDKIIVASLDEVVAQKAWLIPKLRDTLRQDIQKKLEEKKKSFKQALTVAVKGSQPPQQPEDKYIKVTVQSDKEIDFLTLKKVMYSVTEAGGEEINFAVAKKEEEKAN